MSPSYNMMIEELNSKERRVVTKEGLMELEFDIVYLFGCDFNFNCHGIFIERFLRVLSYH